MCSPAQAADVVCRWFPWGFDGSQRKHHCRRNSAGLSCHYGFGSNVRERPRGRFARRARHGGRLGESGLTGGGFENQIVVSPTDPAHLLLASDIGGIQYSDDGGATWLPRNAYAYGNLVTRVASIEWDPNWPGVAYALVGDGHTGELLRSGDYGFTWAPVTTSLVGAGDGVDPAIHASTGLPMGHPRPIGTLISFDSGYVLTWGRFRAASCGLLT